MYKPERSICFFLIKLDVSYHLVNLDPRVLLLTEGEIRGSGDKNDHLVWPKSTSQHSGLSSLLYAYSEPVL